MTFPPSVEHLALPSSSRRSKSRPTSNDFSQSLNKTDAKLEEDTRVGVGGISLDFGRDGGVGLEKGRKGWGWTWACDDRSDLRYTLGEEQTCLFPPTKSLDPKPNQAAPKAGDIIETSIKYAEELCDPYERDGLRSTISSILLEEHAGPSNTSKQPAHADFPFSDQGNGADPYAEKGVDVYLGQTVAVVRNERAMIARTMLAFPTGEVGHYLNISPFIPASKRSYITKVDPRQRLRFAPTTKVVERFPTPILQLCSSPVVSSSRIDRESTALIVRLQSTTHLLNIVPEHSYMPPTTSPSVTSIRAAQLSYEDTEGRRHVDVALDTGAWSRALIVDEGGGVWLWWEEKERRGPRDDMEKVMNLRKVRSAVTDQKHQFFRVTFGTRPGTALVISSRKAITIDIDDPDHPATTLLELRGKDRYFTSLDKTAQERGLSHSVLCTTHEVIWLDESQPDTPLLSWKHDYGAGKNRDLEVTAGPGVGTKDTGVLLHSRSQPMIMVFHTTKSSPLRSLSQPYAFTLRQKQSTTILPLNLPSIRQFTTLISIAPDGALYSSSMLTLKNKTEPRYTKHSRPLVSDVKAIWNEDVHSLASSSRTKVGVGEGWEKMAKVKSKEMNFRWAWLEINQPFRAVSDEGEIGGWFSSEEFERHLRELDAPLEHLMTAGDLARDSLYSQSSKIHSHLLAPLPIHTQAVATTLESLDKVDVSRRLPVAAGISSSLSVYQDARPPIEGSSATPSVMTIFNQLQQSFPTSMENTARSRMDAAQLALDLALSRLVLSSDDLSIVRVKESQAQQERERSGTPVEPDDLFAQAAGQLSLKEKEPPKIKFHFLTPRPNANENEIDGEAVSESLEDGLQGLTARGLMNDWKLGEDPTEWRWSSWRKDDDTNLIGQTQSSYPNRVIKPLPSPRHSPSIRTQVPNQSQKQSQNSFPTLQTFSRPPQSQTQPPFAFPVPPSLGQTQNLSQTTKSLPQPPVRGMQRSSPPPSAVPMGDDDGGGMKGWASTQVERGVFGGREKKGKKGGKKRVGGF
ncbi:hypothetical protein CI109_107360 [Kwoniella shandongensis]|uniref:Uncharacterized protein n=1 Tax=Kwoniella shandongensis TaxID=1734106 RepID=A0A5M6BVP8_9TREE|nr:uncharacterized protein CI109_004712 [Kwoniella shandongensis]KAA5526936.1 hypothetical protein CI109_004712 [Kwoniella shandongensis]